MSKGGGGNPWLIALTVTLGAFMEVLDTTIVNVALPHIAGTLAVSSDNATWALTTYLVMNGIVLTISSSLSQRIGRKRYFLISVAGFTATSLGCGLSTNFVELLLFRGLQGFFGGGLQPTQQAIILQVFPPEKRQAAFSLAAVATIIAPVLGPLVGGVLTDNFSWHWIFLINLPVGLLTFFAGAALIQSSKEDEEAAKHAPPFDYWGLMFVTLALGCMELACDRGEDYDWLASRFVQIMVVLSVIGYVVGPVYLLRAKNPVINLRVFLDRNFALSWFSIAAMGFVLYASAVVIPQFAQQQLGYDATWAGLVLAPGAVVLVMLIPIVGRLQAVVPAKWVVAFGGIALAGALYRSMGLVPDMDFFHLTEFRAGQTAALAFLFVPISSVAYTTIPKALNDDAASLFSMARNVYGGVGISISTALVTDHQQIRQAHLVQWLDPTWGPYQTTLGQVQQALVANGSSMQQAIQGAPGQMFQMLRSQASTLAYIDVFFITALMSLLITVAGVMMKGVKASGGGAPAG